MAASTEGKDGRLSTPSKPTWRRDALEWASETIENGASASISPDTAYALARTLLAMQEQIDGCGKYTKDGETIAQAMERHWQDSQNALTELAAERLKREAAEKRLSGENLSVECNVGKDGAWITLKSPKGSFSFQPIQEFGIHNPFRSKVIDWAEHVQQFAVNEAGE